MYSIVLYSVDNIIITIIVTAAHIKGVALCVVYSIIEGVVESENQNKREIIIAPAYCVAIQLRAQSFFHRFVVVSQYKIHSGKHLMPSIYIENTHTPNIWPLFVFFFFFYYLYANF